MITSTVIMYLIMMI